MIITIIFPPKCPDPFLYKNKAKPVAFFLCTQVPVPLPHTSSQAEALIVINGLHQPGAEDLLAAVLGQVQEIVAGVRHGQVLFPAGCGLDDDAKA